MTAASELRTSPARVAPDSARAGGTLYALLAYGLWGSLPLYWKALKGIPMWETLAHRAIWSLATIVLFLFLSGRIGNFLRILRNPRKLGALGLSAVFIGANWSLYVWSMDHNQVIQASLGYYINPLVSVGMGVFLLRERLRRLQIAAVALAAVGVVLLGLEHQGLPWIALGLAATFSMYGLLKKRIDVEPLAGLGAETLFMLPLALLYLASLSRRGLPQTLLTGGLPCLLLVGTGLITLAPLFFFNAAARRLPLSALGFFQYLSPTIQLVFAVTLFGEPFTRRHLIAFAFIWAALALYTLNGWRMNRRKP